VSSLVEQHTFFAGCLARTPFRSQVEGAALAGFDSMSIWPNIWRHAQRKDGLTTADMRMMLDDNGLTLTDVDAYRDWAPPPTKDSIEFGPISSGVPRLECLEVCQQLGGSTIIAVHLTDAPLDEDRDVEAFAQLCDDAREFGLRIALEFVAFSNVPDVATAMRIVEGAGRDNGGLCVDLWHHARSTYDDAALARIPADKVYTVQICDAPARPEHGLVEEAMYHRQWPGTGDLDITGFLRTLDDLGARASVGVEMYQPSFQDRDPSDVIRELHEASSHALARAGIDPHSTGQ